MKSLSLWLTVALSLVLSNAGLAQAQASADQARALVDQGVALRREGHDADAVILFRRAFALQANGRTEAQLGLGLLAIGEFVSAYDHLEHAMTSDEEWITRNHAALLSSLEAASAHVGMVEITGDDVGANVNVNGERVGQLPLGGPVRVQTGRAIIDVTMEGYRSFSADVQIAPGQVSRVSVHMVQNLAPDVLAGGDVTQQDWFWPLTIGLGALVVAGVTLGLVVGLSGDGPFEHSDVGGIVMTLQVSP